MVARLYAGDLHAVGRGEGPLTRLVTTITATMEGVGVIHYISLAFSFKTSISIENAKGPWLDEDLCNRNSEGPLLINALMQHRNCPHLCSFLPNDNNKDDRSLQRGWSFGWSGVAHSRKRIYCLRFPLEDI